MSFDYSRLEVAANRFSESIVAAAEAAGEMLAALAELVMPTLQQIEEVLQLYEEQQAAVSWARSARPTWYAIYYRTKKKRVRKKYLDRIIKDYRQEANYDSV